MEPIATEWTGIDTLRAGFYVIWHDGDILDALNTAKTEAQELHDTILFTPNDWPMLALPTGRPCYQYGIQTNDCTIWIANTQQPAKDTPNVWIEAQPRFCTRGQAPQRLAELAKAFTKHFNGNTIRNTVSEVHLTTDTQTDRPHQITDYYGPDGPKFITKSRLGRQSQTDTTDDVDLTEIITRGSALETFTRGKGDLMLRIYDKQAELAARPHKTWERLNWQNPDAKHVLRTEFQLRRDTLRQLAITTLDDLDRQLQPTWSYLTQKYFRLYTRHTIHPKQTPLAPFWTTIQNAWENPPPEPAPRRNEPHPQTRQLVLQAAGCLAKAMALNNDQPELFDKIMKHYDEKWLTQLHTKAKHHRKKLQAAATGESVTPPADTGGHVISPVHQINPPATHEGEMPKPGGIRPSRAASHPEVPE